MQPSYDASDNVTYDGVNQYIYDGVPVDSTSSAGRDAESRLCAVSSPYSGLTGYFYDAEGIRVAKGSLTTFSCNFASNGFTPTTSYVLGLGSEQIAELSVSGAQGSYVSAWRHTNVFDGLGLQATYSLTGSTSAPTSTYFALNDWLGTKRAEVGTIVDSNGAPQPCAANFASLPYGDGLTASGNCPDATEHHFTGKERDTESGNDYFGARYFASSMGRWMSPDESLDGAIMELPQTWNKYSYEYNRPTYGTDPDGRCPPCAGAIIGGVVQGGFDLGKQLYNNGGSLSKVSWGEVGANTAGGALAGTIAVMTGGTSLVGSALIGDVAAGVTGNVIGGAVTGALDPNTPSDEVMSVGSVSSDALSGFVGGAGGHVAAEFVHVPEEPHFSMNGRNGRVNNQAYRTGLKNLATRDQALTQQEVRSGFVHRGMDMLKDFVNSWFLSGPHCHWQMESVDVTINGVTTHGQTSEHQVCN